jgi:hypothetical protein
MLVEEGMAVDDWYYNERNHRGIEGRERKIRQFPLGAQFTINRTDTIWMRDLLLC